MQVSAGVLCAVMLGAVALPGGAQARRHGAGTGKGASTAGSGELVKNIFWQPNDLVQGSPAFFTVEFARPATRVSGTFVSKPLQFFKTDDAKVWYALAGDDLETAVGSYDLSVTGVLAGGNIAKSSKKVDVGDGKFKTGTVDVPENFVEPDAAGKKEIALDEAAKARAYGHSAPKPLWSGGFISPVNGRPTETFGESRILNEEKSSTHRGTDFPVSEGTPVVASNSGVVVLAKEMFYEGNCVIVDHGDRFYTIYMHLSKMEVKAGDKVEKGAKLGLSGKTGRVTGPHMHMGVRWNGAYLDPVKLLALTLPKMATDEAAKTTMRATSHRR